jgi:hypothetical protein
MVAIGRTQGQPQRVASLSRAETCTARHFRDARIAPIHEGTNGIQAIDLVTRKLPPVGGAAIKAYMGEGMSRLFLRGGHDPKRRHWLAGLAGFELRNVILQNAL